MPAAPTGIAQHDQKCRAADVRIKQAGDERHRCYREPDAQCAVDRLCRRCQANWSDRHDEPNCGQVEQREGQPVKWLNAGQQLRQRGERGEAPAPPRRGNYRRARHSGRGRTDIGITSTDRTPMPRRLNSPVASEACESAPEFINIGLVRSAIPITSSPALPASHP